MPATDPLPPVTDEHRRQAFALNAHKWPGVTFEEALRVDIRRKLIEVCAHALRTAEARADRRQQQYRAPRWSADKCTARKIHDHILRSGSNSIGDFERLAGVNTCNHAERVALWDKFKHLFATPGNAAMDAVMAECRRVAARRVNAGELTLWLPSMAQGGAA